MFSVTLGTKYEIYISTDEITEELQLNIHYLFQRHSGCK